MRQLICADLRLLIEEALKTPTFSNFKIMWQMLGFTELLHSCPRGRSVELFTQLVFDCIVSLLRSNGEMKIRTDGHSTPGGERTASWNNVVVFCLFCAHGCQALTPPQPIQLTPRRANRLFEVFNFCNPGVDSVLLIEARQLLVQLLATNSIEIVSTSGLVNSVQSIRSEGASYYSSLSELTQNCSLFCSSFDSFGSCSVTTEDNISSPAVPLGRESAAEAVLSQESLETLAAGVLQRKLQRNFEERAGEVLCTDSKRRRGSARSKQLGLKEVVQLADVLRASVGDYETRVNQDGGDLSLRQERDRLTREHRQQLRLQRMQTEQTRMMKMWPDALQFKFLPSDFEDVRDFLVTAEENDFEPEDREPEGWPQFYEDVLSPESPSSEDSSETEGMKMLQQLEANVVSILGNGVPQITVTATANAASKPMQRTRKQGSRRSDVKAALPSRRRGRIQRVEGSDISSLGLTALEQLEGNISSVLHSEALRNHQKKEMTTESRKNNVSARKSRTGSGRERDPSRARELSLQNHGEVSPREGATSENAFEQEGMTMLQQLEANIVSVLGEEPKSPDTTKSAPAPLRRTRKQIFQRSDVEADDGFLAAPPGRRQSRVQRYVGSGISSLGLTALEQLEGNISSVLHSEDLLNREPMKKRVSARKKTETSHPKGSCGNKREKMAEFEVNPNAAALEGLDVLLQLERNIQSVLVES